MDKDNNNEETTKINERNNSADRQKREQRLLDAIRSDKNKNIFLLTCVVGVSLAIGLEIINAQNRRHVAREQTAARGAYWVYSAHNDVDNRRGLLRHVHAVLDRVGYEKVTSQAPWNLLWSHDYPFRVLATDLQRLNPNQKVNHFPGTGFITNKVDLATSDSKYIPKAFKIPQNKEAFLKYAAGNKNALFLEKHNQHRGVFLKNVSDIDLTSGASFVQEYVQKPYLVDGHKFDIGVYVVLTSVNPLRAYWYKGDVLFRYCPAKYYPFDPSVLDKYVVGDDYLPTWEVPSLAHPYTALGFSMKDTFDHYAASKGGDVTGMWQQVEAAIAEVLLKKEHHVIQALKKYPSTDNFFEMMRFDLVVDEDLKVYLLEANMSPNLSSAHYPPNQLLYEQVLYNLMAITGVSSHVQPEKFNDRAAQNMVSSQKNIAVWSEACSSVCRDNCEESLVCGLCRPCMSSRLKNSLLHAHREFLHRGDFRRLFPPKMAQNASSDDKIKDLNKMNQLLYLWYQGKCNADVTWCS